MKDQYPQDETTLNTLRKQYPKIEAFLREHGYDFAEAIGLHAPEDEMVLCLAKFAKTFGGRQWQNFKDEIDRARCNAVQGFMGGSPGVDNGDLRTAIALLIQAHNQACDLMAASQRRPPHRPPRPARQP
jgi:hypothetical protein